VLPQLRERHRPRRSVDPHRERLRAQQHLDQPPTKEHLDDLFQNRQQAGVVDADASPQPIGDASALREVPVLARQPAEGAGDEAGDLGALGGGV
jgi:hypothetical protein